MDTQGQIGYFLVYVVIGFFVGFIYEPFAFFRLFFKTDKYKTVGVVLDILFWISACILVSLAVFYLQIPSFRLYMWIGFIVGGIIYCKTLRRILAFLENLCYNNYNSILKKIKKRRKATRNKVEHKV